jgi:hypothetical protein
MGGAVLALVAYGVGWLFFRGDALSADFKDERLDKVVAYFEKKTGLTIKTSLDPATPVTLFFRDASVGDALDSLALAVEGRASLHAVLAGTRAEVDAYIAGLVASSPPEDWTVHRVAVPGFLLTGEGVRLPDPRTVPLAVPEAWPQGSLQGHLRSLAESSEVVWAAPAAWDPVVKFDPGAVAVEGAFSRLLKSAKAEGRMFVFLRSGWGGGDGGGGREGRSAEATPGESRRMREMPDPAVVARRVEQQIASLPREEQAAARKTWEADRAFWEELRQLPPEQRREKIMERMENPAVQERMESAQAERDARRSPEKRRDRYRDYINRKQQAGS